MINRQRLSTVLFFISLILLFYPALFKLPYTFVIVSISWSFLAISRALLLFPDLNGKMANVVLGKEIKR